MYKFCIKSLVLMLVMFMAAGIRAEEAGEIPSVKAAGSDSTGIVSAVLSGKTGQVPADTIPMYLMDEIVVTGRRKSSKIRDLALSVSVINEKEVGSTMKNSSTDLAGVLPGIFIDRTGDFGRSDVSIRGLGSRGRYSLVLVDGRPEKMALFDCTVTHSFPLNDVERIEVVKGASSMLYGSGALGGVMNVIPRRVRDEMEIDLKSYGGSNETFVTNSRVAGRRGRVAGHISMDYRESAGHVEHSAYEGKDIRAGGEILLNDEYSLFLSSKYFDGYKEEPVRFTDNPSTVSDTWNDYRRGSFDLHLKGINDRYTTSLRYYRNFGEHEFSDGWHSKDATDGAMAYGTAKATDALEFSYGADYRYQQGRLPDTPDAEWSKWEAGAYFAAQYSLGKTVILSAGARYNRDEIAGDETSPSAGIVWRPKSGTSVRTLVSHGFRSPQINELYMYPPSNEDLKAEKVWNYEAGLRQELPGNTAIDIAVFRMEGLDMIQTVPNPYSPPPMTFANSGEFEFTGVEASLTGAWNNGLGGRLSYSWLDAGEWTTGRPGSKLDMITSYSHERFMVELKGQLVDEYYAGNDKTLEIDPFTVIDIYAESRIGRGVTVFTGINNILDEEYAVYADLASGAAGLYEMPGITFMAGLRCSY